MIPTFTLAGFSVYKATLRAEDHGVWTADVTLSETAPLTVGQRVTLVLGNLPLVGTLRPGGDFGGTTTWTVVGGAGKWDATLPPPTTAPRDDNGITVATVAAELANATGETIVLNGADRVLGYAWTRPGGLASDAIRSVAGRAWYVATDGVTHIGPPPVVAASSPLLTVDSYDVNTGRATVRIADEALSILWPGAVITAAGLPAPLPVRAIIAHVTPGDIRVEVFGELGLAGLVLAIVSALTSGTRFHPPQPYAVAEVATTLASVSPADARSLAFPPERYLDQLPGVPGMTAVLARGMRVLVSFPSGDPASPAIVGYYPDVPPESITLTATSAINAGGTSALAKAVATFANENALRLGIIAAGGPDVTLVPIATTILKGG